MAARHPEERAELGCFAGDASVRLLLSERGMSDSVIAGGESTTDVSDEAVYADSVQQLENRSWVSSH